MREQNENYNKEKILRSMKDHKPEEYNKYNNVDHSSPGSSVQGILKARMLEWVAIPFSRGPSQCRD